MKSHFADEERLRKRGKNSWGKDFGQIHLCEVSLRGRRETSGAEIDFGEYPSQTTQTKRDFILYLSLTS